MKLVVIRAALAAVAQFVVFQAPLLLLADSSERSEVKIGVLAPLTGIRSDAGAFISNAIKLAQEDLANDQSIEFKFLLEDTKYEPKEAVTGLRKLIDSKKIKFLIGPYGSSEVLAVAPITERNKLIMMVPGAQSDEISDAGQMIYRIIHNTRSEAPIFAKFIAGKLGKSGLCVIAIETAFSVSYLAHFTPSFMRHGGRITGKSEFPPEESDFRPRLLQCKRAEAAGIISLATPRQTGLMLLQAHQLGVRAQFFQIGVESPELVEVAGELAEGLIYPYSYDSQGIAGRARDFFNQYKNRFGHEPDAVAANTFDSAMLLARCIGNSGTSSEQVANCLYGIKNYAGVSGVITINSSGDADKPIFLKTIRAGKLVRLDEQ